MSEQIRITKKFSNAVEQEIRNKIKQFSNEQEKNNDNKIIKTAYEAILYLGDSDDYTQNMHSKNIQPIYDYVKQKIDIPNGLEQEYRDKIIDVVVELVEIKKSKKIKIIPKN